MKAGIGATIVALVTIAAAIFYGASGVQAGKSATTVTAGLKPLWSDGIIGDGVGPANIIIDDLDNDGRTDLLACSGSAYVLNKGAGVGYETVWYGEVLPCGKVAVGDRNNDDVKEIYIAAIQVHWLTEQAVSNIRIYDSSTFQEVGAIEIPGNSAVNDLAVADVDGDNKQEIVVVTSENTLIYDATSLSLQWTAQNKGGQQLAIGQIDGSPDIEVVVNGETAHVLNVAAQSEKWAYSGGFGQSMAIGNVDGDARAEIAFTVGGGYSDSYLHLFDATTQTDKWRVGPIFGLQIVAIGDSDSNGTNDVVTGDGQWGQVRGFSGTNGAELWGIGNPEHGVSGLAIGDVDDDGTIEVAWGAGLTSSGKDALFIGSPTTETVEWDSGDIDGPLYVAAADIDNDGATEIVVATGSTTSGYQGGTIMVYDSASHKREWSVVVADSFFNLNELGVGQLDSDPALEIVVGGNNWYNTRLTAFDGITHENQWLSGVLGQDSPKDMLVKNVDDDATDEIIVGLSNNVQVFNGASQVIQWDSNSLEGTVQDIAIGNLDGAPGDELAVLTDANIYVFSGTNWSQKATRPLLNGRQIQISKRNSSTASELLITTLNSNGQTGLLAWSGTTYSLLWQDILDGVVINDIFSGDIDQDGSTEFVLTGHHTNQYTYGPSLLLIGAESGASYVVEYDNTQLWGSITGVVLADLEGDSKKELLFGSSTLFQVDTITTNNQPRPTNTPRPTFTPTSTPTIVPIPFSDVSPSEYFYEPVQYLARNGILSGYDNAERCLYGTPCFLPFNNATRGQMAKIIILAEGISTITPATPAFDDVPRDNTFFTFVETAVNRGIISGYADHTFRPFANITRGQLCKILANAEGWTGINPTNPTFADVPRDNPFYKEIETAVAHGIISGYDLPGGGREFRWGSNATRGQIAKIIYQAITASAN